VRSLENFWETLDELEDGMLSKLSTLARERRWEVIFLTSRPRSSGETTQVQTQRWLESKGFARPSVFVVTGSRGLIAAALDLDAVIDDRMENCMVSSPTRRPARSLSLRDTQPLHCREATRMASCSTPESVDALRRLSLPLRQAASHRSRREALGLKEPLD
jgi:hypothetical protein